MRGSQFQAAFAGDTVVYSAAADLGLGIGRDLAVTGFDGSVIASLLSPQTKGDANVDGTGN